MKIAMLVLPVFLLTGCSYTRIVVDCNVRSQITPVVPVVISAKVDLSRPAGKEVQFVSRRLCDGAEGDSRGGVVLVGVE